MSEAEPTLRRPKTTVFPGKLIESAVIVTRHYPFPQLGGAWIYTTQMISLWAKIAQRLDVFCCLHQDSRRDAGIGEVQAKLEYHFGRMSRRPLINYLLSAESRSASEFANAHNRQALLNVLIDRAPDAVAIDHIGSTWALPVLEQAEARTGKRPFLVYITHNEETSTRLSIAKAAQFPANLAHAFDALRIRRRDARALDAADLITCNTEADLDAYRRQHRRVPGIVLSPIYTRAVVSSRTIDQSVPRKLIVVGSFLWSAKLINLKRFLAATAHIATERGVSIEIVGRMRESDRTALQKDFPSVALRGEVESVAPYLAEARLGLLIDDAGGGFKHTALTYAFGRVPVAALDGALSGEIAVDHCLTAGSFATLVNAACDAMDNFARLNAMHEGLFSCVTHYLTDEDNLGKLRGKMAELLPARLPAA
jgi:hypothetical protein